MNAHRAKKTAALILSAGAVTGCAGAFEAETDTASPIAPRVQALVDANREYPRWADFPKASTTTPPAVEVASRVRGLASQGTALADEAARIEWTLGDPATLAREITARVDAQQISPVTAETQAEVEAFAAEARRRGVAPPPVDRAPSAQGPAPR
jgi:hypothetical protein